jgi:hypothetical protein
MIRDRIARLPEEPPEEQAATIRQLVASVTLRPIDKNTGEVDLAINLPRLLSAGEFVRQCPVVEVAALRTNKIAWGAVVCLA